MSSRTNRCYVVPAAVVYYNKTLSFGGHNIFGARGMHGAY